MKKLVLTLSILGCFNAAAGSKESTVWQDFGQNSKNISNLLNVKKELKQRSLLLDESLLKSRLSSVNNKLTAAKGVSSKLPTFEINLPLPDGTMLKVNATQSKVITDSMAEAHPEIKTWNVRGVDDPDITGVIDFTSKGFHGMLMMPDGDTIFIDPNKEYATSVYNSFSKKENADAFAVELNCGAHDDHNLHFDKHLSSPEFAIKTSARALNDSSFPNVSISQIKTYRLALSATAEYTNSQGGVNDARAAMVTSVNRINPVFTRDLGVSLELIDSPELIFTDTQSDPFSNPNNPGTLMRENGDYLSDQGKLGEFDIGHVVSGRTTGGGSGVAFLGVACIGDLDTSNYGLIKGLKAAGATTSSNPSGSTFDLVLLAHELGHQLGANHSFNSSQGANCSNGRSEEVAVEPGSGSSIMAYSGLCGSDDLIENPRDDFFHFASITQVNNYTRLGSGSSCGTSSNISVPSASAGADLKIPANTPFLLDGASSGGTSSWDQIDIGSASAVDVDTGNNAIIRHKIPTLEQDRYIPSLANLFSGTTTKGEILPTSTRELNFAYVVRNEGIKSDKKTINVTNTNNAFRVLSQDAAQTVYHNQNIEVNWETAGTNQAPISCSNVDIQLIREDGNKDMLLASTLNDGTESIVISDKTPSMSNARIFVGCIDNSFFNISSGNIRVLESATSTDTVDPVITIQGSNPISIEEGTSYLDAGATAIDDFDGNIAVTSTGNVNTDEVGSYTVNYTATDAAGNNATAIRTVNVIPVPDDEPPVITVIEDTTPPVITLSVDTEIVLQVGQEFVEPGFSASDDQDGTTLVTVEGLDKVDTSKAGEYIITYTSVDESGNRTVVERTIVVTEDSGQNPGNELTSESSGGGGSFAYLLMPLMIILCLRRPKLIPIRVKKD